MQIYTRYKAVGRRPSLRAFVQLALAAAGLGLVGWVVYRAARSEPEPAAVPTLRGLPLTVIRTNQAPTTNQAPITALTPPRLQAALPPAPASSNPVAAGPIARPLPAAPPAPTTVDFRLRPVTNVLEAQVALASRGISSGAIDGALGYQTRAALRALQRATGVPVSGALDAPTRAHLTLTAPALTTYVVRPEDVAGLLPVSPTWLGKSQQPRLGFSTVLELVAEQHRAHPDLMRRLNPGVDWTNAVAGLTVNVPQVPAPMIAGRLAFIRIGLQDRVLSAYDLRTNLLLHFPCSIASRLEKRPLGRLEVVKVALDPTYTFNPAIFPESAEARRLKRKLTLPPGPNNPVGVAWIGLDRPGYGIHGTPRPEDVGRTESHGCFRLANWDAAVLARLVSPGLPVYVGY